MDARTVRELTERISGEVVVPTSPAYGAHGLATNDDGMVLDLAHFDQVAVHDPAQHLVRVRAGTHWGNVASALAAHNLAISSGDTRQVGVGGLTLGGGIRMDGAHLRPHHR